MWLIEPFVDNQPLSFVGLDEAVRREPAGVPDYQPIPPASQPHDLGLLILNLLGQPVLD